MNASYTALHKLGYSEFIGEQRKCVDCLLGGQDLIAMLPTGSGKSVIYQVCALAREGVGVVVSPLISLMSQQVERLKQSGIRAEFLNSQLNGAEQNDLFWRLRQQQVDILYLSPEKLLQPSIMGLLDDLVISVLAVDEAHCVLSWGQQFRPEYALLGQLKQRFPDTPMVALSGSLGDQAITRLQHILKLNVPEVVRASVTRDNLRLRISQKQNGKHQLLGFLMREMAQKAGIVYCRGRRQSEQLAAFLREHHVVAGCYHAGLTDEDRNRIHHQFENGDIKVLIATVAYGMGLDIQHVDYVVHMDLPLSLEQYVQEIGRAGRRGQAAEAILFYGLQDVLKGLRFVAEQGEGEDAFFAMLRYLESKECRQQALAGEFASSSSAPCGHCDRCRNQATSHDASVSAQKILTLIHATRGLVNFQTMIDVLIGKSTKSVIELGLQQHRLFGVGRELTANQWKSLIRKLIAIGGIEILSCWPLQLALTPTSRAIFKSEQRVVLQEDYLYRPLSGEQIEHWLQSSWQKVYQWATRYNSGLGFSETQLHQIHEAKPASIAAVSRLTGVSKEVLLQHGIEDLLHHD